MVLDMLMSWMDHDIPL